VTDDRLRRLCSRYRADTDAKRIKIAVDHFQVGPTVLVCHNRFASNAFVAESCVSGSV